MGYYFQKHHPPHNRREICATDLYMENSLLKIDYKVIQEWENAVLTLTHTVILTTNYTVLQGCANVIRTYGHTKLTTAT